MTRNQLLVGGVFLVLLCLFLLAGGIGAYFLFLRSSSDCFPEKIPVRHLVTGKCRWIEDSCSLPILFRRDERCLPFKETGNKTPPVEPAITDCEKTSDCHLVPAGCCSCNEGGKMVVINRQFVDDWQQNLGKECAEVACVQVVSDHCSCQGIPQIRCLAGKCVDERCL